MYAHYTTDLRYELGRYSDHANAIRLRDALARHSIACRIDTRLGVSFVWVGGNDLGAAKYIRNAEFA